jgi:hypothetical protein
MKRTTGILTSLILVAGLAWGQSPQIIQNTRNQMQTVQNNATAASNQALGDKPASKPAAGAHSTAGQTKTGASPAASQAKTGSAASAQSKPAAAQAKSAGTVAAKPTAGVNSASVKTGASSAAAQAAAQAKTGKGAPAQSKPFPVQAKSAGAVAVKPAVGAKSAKVAVQPKKAARAQKGGASAKSEGNPKGSAAGAAEAAKNDDKDSPDKKWSAGKRDPFVSPVVTHVGGSGCNTGKKCLEIGAINLRGVVRSENGFIAVVTNTMNKAYFLRENDPVFDGYVVKITDDSITFKEMLQDRLGKPLSREVVKKIPTPAV